MRVQFEFTLDDFADAQKRFSARWKVLRSEKWKATLYVGAFAWLLVFVFFLRTPLKGAILGLAAAVISALWFPSANRRAYEKRMRRISREILGDASTFLCEVELKPEGVWIRQGDYQILHEWQSVEEINETSDSVDIFTKSKSGVVVRNRAFTSTEDRLRFIDLARTRANSACSQPRDRQPSSDIKPI